VKWESVTFCQPFVKALLKTCFSGLKSSRWVGDFQVATGGGFWVATREHIQLIWIGSVREAVFGFVGFTRLKAYLLFFGKCLLKLTP
ncbi:MAG: hypothetical protein Q8O28_14080, partial [Smithellaceae bacterium]|nr:hypothetical protein [Smithellaceae bacterium]